MHRKMDRFIGAVLVLLLVFIVVGLFATMRAEAICLEAGYPKAAVTWKFDIYCKSYEGAVTPIVRKQ